MNRENELSELVQEKKRIQQYLELRAQIKTNSPRYYWLQDCQSNSSSPPNGKQELQTINYSQPTAEPFMNPFFMFPFTPPESQYQFLEENEELEQLLKEIENKFQRINRHKSKAALFREQLRKKHQKQNLKNYKKFYNCNQPIHSDFLNQQNDSVKIQSIIQKTRQQNKLQNIKEFIRT